MKSFDQIWENIHATQEWGKYPSESVIRFVARNYYSRRREEVKILDFGCGAGSNTCFLAREGFDTYAFDGAESAVNKVRKRLDNEGLNAHLSVSDALQLEYSKEFFDCVVDNVVVYANKIEQIVKMYEYIYRILKKGGKLFAVVFTKNTTGFGTGKEIEPGTYEGIEEGSLVNRGKAHFFDKEEICTLLEKIGFTNIVVDTLYFTDRGGVVEQYLVQAEK